MYLWMNPEFKNTCFLPFALKNVIALFSCNAEHEGNIQKLASKTSAPN